MDQDMLRAIVAANYAVPAGQSVTDLTEALLALLGSTDPSLREPAPEILDAWIERHIYTAAELRALTARMVDNLEEGLGERDTDSVFLRAFSLLVLTSIVNEDNMQTFYASAEVQAILAQVLTYAATERDLRGFIQGKGWAHAVAHTADLLWVLASNRHLGDRDLEHILATIASLAVPSVAHVYLHNEHERLAHTALGVLHRNLVPPAVIDAWIEQLVQADGRALSFSALMSEPDSSRRHDAVAFLRGLYFQLAGLTYTPEALPPGLPEYIANQIRHAPRCAEEVLPCITAALRTISVF